MLLNKWLNKIVVRENQQPLRLLAKFLISLKYRSFPDANSEPRGSKTPVLEFVFFAIMLINLG